MTQPPDDGAAPRSREQPGDRARRIAREAREHEAAERRALSDRVDELERRDRNLGADLNVPEHLAALSERLEALEAATPKPGKLRPPFDWDDLTDPGERAAVMQELTTWVHDVLLDRYRSRLGRHGLPEGWQAEQLLRDIVTAAWLAWLYAYKNPGARLTEQWQWHRDVLAHLGSMLEDATTSVAARDRAVGNAR